MARPEGFVRSFVEYGTSLTPLLRRAIGQGIEPAYARRLLGIIEAEERQRQSRRTRRVSVPGSPESLSQRELEVLRLIAAGLSNRELSEKLNISLNTAKRHVYNVSQRLHASSRTQAIAKAKDLKLI